MNTIVCSNALGNLTADRKGYRYQYDYENRVTKILKSGPTTVAEYSYDALGRRVRKIDSIASVTRLYYYDKDWRAITEYDQNGNLKRRLVFGNYIDEALYGLGSSPSYQYFYVHDHLYSTVALYRRITGVVCERYEYDAYGQPTIYTNAGGGTWWDGDETTSSASAMDNTYMFTGRQVDILDGGSLKIQYNRNRYYDYYTGRWTTQDPLGYVDGFNLYQYVHDRPLTARDALGAFAESDSKCDCCTHLYIKRCWAYAEFHWRIHSRGTPIDWGYDVPSAVLEIIARVGDLAKALTAAQAAGIIDGALPTLKDATYLKLRVRRKEKFMLARFECNDAGAWNWRKGKIQRVTTTAAQAPESGWWESGGMDEIFPGFAIDTVARALLNDNKGTITGIMAPGHLCVHTSFTCKKGDTVVRVDGARPEQKCEKFKWKTEY